MIVGKQKALTSLKNLVILVSASGRGELVSRSGTNSGIHCLSFSEYLFVWTKVFNAMATNERLLEKTKRTGSDTHT